MTPRLVLNDGKLGKRLSLQIPPAQYSKTAPNTYRPKCGAQVISRGTWVCGTLHDHRFTSLVFPEHAENESYEIGTSRISKLWVQRLADKATTYNWDRGLDQPAADAVTQAIVDFLAGGLANGIYAA